MLVVQHAPGETAGTLGRVLDDAGARVRTVHAYLGEPVPRALDGAAGKGAAGGVRALVLLGGPMAVYEADRRPHLRDALRLTDAALAAGVPVLGLCLGSQLLAAALGAPVRPTGRLELGWYPVRRLPPAAGDPLWDAVPDTFLAFHWHGDAYDVPPGARAVAASDATPCQAFRHGAATCGVQFHAELTPPLAEAMIANSGADLAAAGLDAAALRAGVRAYQAGLATVAAGLFTRWAAAAGVTTVA